MIPGVSRSGSTIVAGLFGGIERSSAARFSFLLSIPAILGAAVLTLWKNGDELFSGAVEAGTDAVGNGIAANLGGVTLLIGFFSAFFVGLASIAFLMRFLKTHTLTVFSVYLIAVGLGAMIF